MNDSVLRGAQQGADALSYEQCRPRPGRLSKLRAIVSKGVIIMVVIIKKWGNCAAVRIPAAIMAAAHVGLDQSVDVREEQGGVSS